MKMKSIIDLSLLIITYSSVYATSLFFNIYWVFALCFLYMVNFGQFISIVHSVLIMFIKSNSLFAQILYIITSCGR